VSSLTSPKVARTAEQDRRSLIFECLHDLDGVDVIYAIRCKDGLIKIGWSRNLTNRRRHFASDPTALLAVMLGNRGDEQVIHQRLAAHCARGSEYYHPTSGVLEFVNEIRERCGVAPIG
jgi:hypothetical protein